MPAVARWLQTEGEAAPASGTATVDVRSRVRRHVVEMAKLDMLAYDPGADTVWMPEDVTITVAPAAEPSEETSEP